MALAQLAAVRHSSSNGPVAAAAIEQLCRAALGADAAVRAAVAGVPAGGQLGSAAASAVAVHLECLEAALRVALPAKVAIDTLLAPLAHSASQLAVMVLQSTALQVHSFHDSNFPRVGRLAPAWLGGCSTHQHSPASGNVAVGVQGIQFSLALVLLRCRNTLLSSSQQRACAPRWCA